MFDIKFVVYFRIIIYYWSSKKRVSFDATFEDLERVSFDAAFEDLESKSRDMKKKGKEEIWGFLKEKKRPLLQCSKKLIEKRIENDETENQTNKL